MREQTTKVQSFLKSGSELRRAQRKFMQDEWLFCRTSCHTPKWLAASGYAREDGKRSRTCQWVAGIDLDLLDRLTWMKMQNSTKAAHSSAIRAEVKRHESLQKTISKLLKQLERVEDQHLRTGLKVYIHGVQGESTFNRCVCSFSSSLIISSPEVPMDCLRFGKPWKEKKRTYILQSLFLI